MQTQQARMFQVIQRRRRELLLWYHARNPGGIKVPPGPTSSSTSNRERSFSPTEVRKQKNEPGKQGELF